MEPYLVLRDFDALFRSVLVPSKYFVRNKEKATALRTQRCSPLARALHAHILISIGRRFSYAGMICARQFMRLVRSKKKLAVLTTRRATQVSGEARRYVRRCLSRSVAVGWSMQLICNHRAPCYVGV